MQTLPWLGRMAALALLALAPSQARAHEFKAGDLLIRHPWTRATPGGAQVAGGYFSVVNRGPEGDTLTGGSFAAASGFEVHDMKTEGGVMTMRPTGPLPIAPGGTLTLSPSGIHVMFTGLTRPLVKGQMIDGTLTFQHAGVVRVQFIVEGLGAREPAAHDGHAMPDMETK